MNQPILYIAATPIGSINDASTNLKDALKNADLILCEDTRHTKKLLYALKIEHSNLKSLHVHNEDFKAQKFIDLIHKEKLLSIVLVSDAGTPAISDPGSHLIALAHQNSIEVRNIPGPCSLACAMASNGFIQPKTLFAGFLPRQPSKQIAEFQTWVQIAPCIALFFESPKRLKATLKTLLETFALETRICISREISKKFEENTVLTLEEAQLRYVENNQDILGECIVSVEITKECSKTKTKEEAQEFLKLKNDCKIFAKNHQLSSKELYNLISQMKNK